MSEDVSVTGQVVITQTTSEGKNHYDLDISDGTSVGDALLMLEVAKIELYAKALGLDAEYDEEDEGDESSE